MAKRMHNRGIIGWLSLALAVWSPSIANAQSHRLRVVTDDGAPIPYAYVTVSGGTGQITDERGEVSLGQGKAKSLQVSVRRIGYRQWFGRLDLPDTVAVMSVTLSRIAQNLGEVRITDSAHVVSLPLQGFYDRWLMRQKGLLSATFIGPEELDFRHPARITDMLSGLNGVMLKRTGDFQVAYGYAGRCRMTILIDGIRQCPAIGCDVEPRPGMVMSPDALVVPIDLILNANDVNAIEIYARGGNMPVSLQTFSSGCGVIAFWTGSRKP